MKRLDDPEACFLCRRRACGFGVGRRRIGWVCEDCGAARGTKAMAMTVRQFDEYEVRALAAAGEAAGAYLDGLGRTDVGALTPAEWMRLLAIVVHGFGDAIRREVARGIVVDGFGDVVHAHLTTEQLQDAATEAEA